jgi:membrane protease YdiL (CAAX protease family)
MLSRSRGALAGVRTLPPFGAAEALGALGISAVVYLVPGTLVLVALKSWHHELLVEVLTYGFLTLGVLLSALLLVVFRFPDGARLLGYRWPGWETLATAAVAIVPIYAGIGIVYFLFTHLVPGFHLEGNAKEALPVGKHVSAFKIGGLLLFAGVIVPFTEETLFRGILFQGFTTFFSRWWNRHIAVLASALLSGTVFGLAHATPHTTPILIFVGVCLAYVFHYGRSIYASIVVHGLFNALAVVALASTS